MPKWTKWDQTGPNRAKHLPNRVKQGQTMLKKNQMGFRGGKQKYIPYDDRNVYFDLKECFV